MAKIVTKKIIGDINKAAVLGEVDGGGTSHERHDKQMSRPVTWVDTAGLLDWNGRLT